jgi:hypothetical protein
LQAEVGHPVFSRRLVALRRVVPVAIDSTRCAVLAPVERGAVGGGQVDIVSPAHVTLLTIHSTLAPFRMSGFVRGNLAVADALGNARLLTVLTLLNGGIGLAHRDRCRESRKRRSKEREFLSVILLAAGASMPSS